jgi:hypothetical protein
MRAIIFKNIITSIRRWWKCFVKDVKKIMQILK